MPKVSRVNFCVECGEELAWEDRFCRACGKPQRPSESAPPRAPLGSDGRPVVTEQTAKRWKAIQLAGGLACLLGFVLMLAGGGSSPAMLGAALVIAAAGIVTWAIGSFMAWWRHG